MEAEWWCKTQEGMEDISLPGKPTYFAEAAARPENSKRIPVTDDLSRPFAPQASLRALTNFEIPSDFTKRKLMLAAAPIWRNTSFEGEISGISASNIPFWFRGYYKPGEEIAQMDDWDQKVETIAKNARN